MPAPGHNVAYNARRQRPLNGRYPDDAVRDRLSAKPELAIQLYQPPADPCVLPKAMVVVERAKEVSQPDNLSRLHGWPMRSPTDASPTPSRVPTHGSGPMWIATPFHRHGLLPPT